MKCSNCGAELAESAKFCCECGAKVAKATFCPECGAKCAPSVKFCSECGHRLTGATNVSAVSHAKPLVDSLLKSYIDVNCYGTNQWNLCKDIPDDKLAAIRQAAENGNGNAEYVLGWNHFVENEDVDAAVEFFERGRKKGSAYASFALGRYYQEIGDVRDIKKSFSLIEQSTAQVGVPALWELAFLILEENEISKEPEEALPYLEKMLELCDRGEWDSLYAETAHKLIPAIRGLFAGEINNFETLFDCFTELYGKACAHDTDCGGAPFVVNSWCYGNAFMKILRRFERSIDMEDEERCEAVRNVLMKISKKDDDGEVFDCISSAEDSVFALGVMGDWCLKNDGNGVSDTAKESAKESFEKAAALGDPYSARRLKEVFADDEDDDDDADEMLEADD